MRALVGRDGCWLKQLYFVIPADQTAAVLHKSLAWCCFKIPCGKETNSPLPPVVSPPDVCLRQTVAHIWGGGVPFLCHMPHMSQSRIPHACAAGRVSARGGACGPQKVWKECVSSMTVCSLPTGVCL